MAAFSTYNSFAWFQCKLCYRWRYVPCIDDDNLPLYQSMWQVNKVVCDGKQSPLLYNLWNRKIFMGGRGSEINFWPFSVTLQYKVNLNFFQLFRERSGDFNPTPFQICACVVSHRHLLYTIFCLFAVVNSDSLRQKIKLFTLSLYF